MKEIQTKGKDCRTGYTNRGRGVLALAALPPLPLASYGPATEVYVRQKTQRSFWSYGAVDKSVINRRSVTEEVREREA